MIQKTVFADCTRRMEKVQNTLQVASKYAILLQIAAACLINISNNFGGVPMLRPGLYEQVINKELSDKIDERHLMIK